MTSTHPPGAPLKDFTEQHEDIRFRINGDVFEAARALPGKVLARFAGRFASIGTVTPEEQLDAITDALAMVLLPESANLFAKRLEDLEHPITLEQAGRVIEWLMEHYGKRPTEPSSGSSSGPSSPASGTNSTDAPPQQAPIPATFQPTAG